MKKNTLFFAILMLLGLTFIASCGKEDDDPRDAYVGTYDISYDCVGNSTHNSGDSYDHDYFFIVEKDSYGENGLKFTGMPRDHQVTLSGNDFVGILGSGVSGTFESNRIVFQDLGYHISQNCDEDIPVTAYKR